METAEVKALWLGSRLWGQNSAENGRVVAVTGIPEARMMVTGIHEAVEMEIHEASST